MKRVYLLFFILANAVILAASALSDDRALSAGLLGLLFICDTGFLLWTSRRIDIALVNITKTFAALGTNTFDHNVPVDPLLPMDALREEIKIQEAALKKRLSMDEAMLNNIITPMAIIDPSGNIKWLNEYMLGATKATFEAVPDPRVAIAIGACAILGGLFDGSPETTGGATPHLPVDLFIPGCPPHPYTTLDGLLRLVGRIAR